MTLTMNPSSRGLPWPAAHKMHARTIYECMYVFTIHRNYVRMHSVNLLCMCIGRVSDQASQLMLGHISGVLSKRVHRERIDL